MKYQLRFRKEILNEPVLSKTILETKTPINIIDAKVGQDEGLMVVEIKASVAKEREVIKNLKERGVEVSRFRHVIHKNEKCVDCGYCTSVCPVNAIELRGDEVSFSNEVCIYCGQCIELCPFKGVELVPLE